MNRLAAYTLVLLAAGTPWLEVLLVVPAAIVAGLSTPVVVTLAIVGNMATLLPVIYAGHRLKGRLKRFRATRQLKRSWQVGVQDEAGAAEPSVGRTDTPTSHVVDADDPSGMARSADSRPSGAPGRGRRLFDRYGLAGLALLGPLVTGIHIAAAVAVAADAPRRKTAWWLSAGIAFWAIVSATLTSLGIDLLIDPDRVPDLFPA